MSSCHCPRSAQVTVSFRAGVELVRCTAHDSVAWLRDGRPVSTDRVHLLLREVFVAERGVRRTTGSHRRLAA